MQKSLSCSCLKSAYATIQACSVEVLMKIVENIDGRPLTVSHLKGFAV